MYPSIPNPERGKFGPCPFQFISNPAFLPGQAIHAAGATMFSYMFLFILFILDVHNYV